MRLLRRAAAGDEQAAAAFDHVGTWLGRGIAGMVNVLNPSVVILGGFFARIYPYIEAQTKREAARLALRPSSAVVSIVPSALGVEAPLLGAAELAFEHAARRSDLGGGIQCPHRMEGGSVREGVKCGGSVVLSSEEEKLNVQ